MVTYLITIRFVSDEAPSFNREDVVSELARAVDLFNNRSAHAKNPKRITDWRTEEDACLITLELQNDTPCPSKSLRLLSVTLARAFSKWTYHGQLFRMHSVPVEGTANPPAEDPDEGRGSQDVNALKVSVIRLIVGMDDFRKLSAVKDILEPAR